jgi:hypothetical protein
MKTTTLILALGLASGCAVDARPEPVDESEPFAIAPVLAVDTVEVLLVRHCGDAEDEAELKSEIAYERSESELARAHGLRHAGRKKELEADLALNAASIAKLPTNRKLAYKLAANSIAGLLELSAIKGLAKGKVVKTTSAANTCLTATAGEVKLAVASSTGTVWRPPTAGQFGTAAVKLGGGMWIQSSNDTNAEKIPIYGAVVAISQAGADMIAIDDIRQAMADWNVVLEKAIALEETERAKWEKEVNVHEAKIAELRKQLEELKRRPADNEDGENLIEEYEAIELDETPTGPFN